MRKKSNEYKEKQSVLGKNKVRTDPPKEFLLMNSPLHEARHFNQNQ